MHNYKIVVSYDGTRYKGWQSQKLTDATIQGKLEKILERTVGRPVKITGSGRTDAGVHAKGQTANFYLQDYYEPEELLEIFNQYLPEDIAVRSVKEAGERFHSRFSATEKTYQYRIHTGKIPEVFERKYVYSLAGQLDLERMKQAAEYMTGKQDFAAFCGNRHMKKSTVRNIYEIRFEEVKDENAFLMGQGCGEIRIIFRGNGFLQNMVRIMTGTLIEVGEGRRCPEDIPAMIASKNRELAGHTAPAQGLMLMEVKYD